MATSQSSGATPSNPPSTRERLVSAAFELFAEHGFENVTVEEIAQRAGVGRSTFFRNFATKEDVIFPSHDALLAKIDGRLSTAATQSRDVAVAEAARLVLQHYLSEGAQARTRYQLTSAVPALQAREGASQRQYQRLFTRYLARWWADQPDGALRAELMAASVVTAHNHVLRRWLRGESSDPLADFDHAIELVLNQPSESGATTAVVVLRTDGGVEAVANRLRRALDAEL